MNLPLKLFFYPPIIAINNIFSRVNFRKDEKKKKNFLKNVWLKGRRDGRV